MSEVWKTKYGSRRVRHDPPTLEEAIFAARGITDEIEGQAEIAASLLMSVPTVKAHVTHILTKAGLANRTQIALLAHDAGLA